MNDFEADIYDVLARAVLAEYPNAFTSSRYVRVPSSFPAVSIAEISNVIDVSRIDSSHEEKYSVVTYDVNIYSNLTTGAKDEAKRIAQIIDEKMTKYNFIRQSLQPIDNENDMAIYRINARYTATISDKGKLSLT